MCCCSQQKSFIFFHSLAPLPPPLSLLPIPLTPRVLCTTGCGHYFPYRILSFIKRPESSWLYWTCGNEIKQECIPVGCVPPTLYCTRGVSLDRDPPDRDSPLDKDPLTQNPLWTDPPETPPRQRLPLDTVMYFRTFDSES